MLKKYFKGFDIKYIFIFVSYVMGVMGILRGFTDTYGGTVGNTVPPIILLICFLVFLLSHRTKAYFLHIPVLALLSAVFLYCKQESLIPYVTNIVRGVTELKGLDLYDISYLIIGIGLFAAELIALLAIVTDCTWLYFIIILVFMLITPIIGRGISLLSASLIFLSFTALRIFKKNSAHAIGVCLFSLALICIFFAISQSAVKKGEEHLYDIADNAEDIITDNANSLIFNRLSDYDSGVVNRGNNHQSGKNVMELWVSEKPNEDMYLRGFTGGEYTGGEWKYADEARFFDRISSERGWSRWGNIVDVTYKEIYYNANSASNPSSKVIGRRVTINPLNGNIKSRYYPYVERWERLTRKTNIAYVYSYYELSELNIIKENLIGQTRRIYDDMQKNYEPYIYETYLSFPKNGQERLKALCDDIKAKGLEEKIKYIQNTLAQNAKYTLKPGMAPIDKDIVDYFLFENKRGYCVHFASAATLMFRMMGVPARYVTGYKVNKGLFYPQEDGTYYAVISDKYAHAWPEIYVKDKGWIPIEVTPSPVSTAAYEENNKEQIAMPTTLPLEDTSESNTEEAAGTVKTGSEGIGVPAAAIAVLAALFVAARRAFLLGRIKDHSTRRLFLDITAMLSLCGSELTGLEKDIAQRLHASVPVIEERDWEKLMDTVYGEAYGNSIADEKEKKFVYDIYCKASKHIYAKVGIIKKIYMKLIRVWL